MTFAASDSLHNEYAASINETFFWGPYRPNLYVGIRPRLPDSLMAGLMWSNVDNYENFQHLRHTCEQGDDIAGYGWERYDARHGGRHVVNDIKMGIELQTIFVKLPGGKHGSWALRVIGKPIQAAPKGIKTALIFYAGLDGPGELELIQPSQEPRSPVHYGGHTSDLGDFSVQILESTESDTSSSKPAQTSFLGVKIPDGAAWQAKEILMQNLQQKIMSIQEKTGRDNLPDPVTLFTLPNALSPDSNLHFVQKIFEGAFEFDVVYTSSGAQDDETGIKAKTISTAIETMEKAFDTKFDNVFQLSAPFDTKQFREFGKVLVSNLMGGIGYFHGTSIVDRLNLNAYAEDEEDFWNSATEERAKGHGVTEGPTELFTAVPSRSFFPRGFYWDEGFHLMPISQWDQDLSLEIISSWFNLMDDDGWIAREQILGPEARTKVPPEFTTQYPQFANPPTIFIAIDHFLSRMDQKYKHSTDLEYQAQFDGQTVLGLGSDSANAATSLRAKQYLTELYPKLKRHYDWFRTTQAGEIQAYDREAYSKKEGYRWRGRTPEHCLTSGIDDYPRARPPHPGELHVDLHSWIGLMTRLMQRIAEYVDEHEDAKALEKIEVSLLRNLDDLHWSDKDQAYCDQTVDDYEESVPVCHLGYISIFPVLLGLLPADHPNLGPVLKLIHSEAHLWSPYGLRSLSAQDEFYGTGENYWRGPIWMNINYLALSALYRYYIHVQGPNQALSQQIYDELRRNVVNTVEREYRRSGIIWEQYNPDTGFGQRTKGFTGWTSMIINIIAEEY